MFLSSILLFFHNKMSHFHAIYIFWQTHIGISIRWWWYCIKIDVHIKTYLPIPYDNYKWLYCDLIWREFIAIWKHLLQTKMLIEIRAWQQSPNDQINVKKWAYFYDSISLNDTWAQSKYLIFDLIFLYFYTFMEYKYVYDRMKVV